MNQDRVKSFLNELPRMREDLPFAPEVLKLLFTQTENGSLASLEDVGETLGKDQGLTTRILRLANSAYYGLQAEVISVQRAAAVLGMSEIRNIVLTLAVHGLTQKYSVPKHFNLGGYWAHQFLVAMLAKKISNMIDVGNPDYLFTVGLLHDVGKLITALKRPDDWQAILDLAEEKAILDIEAEEEYWGLDHAVVGALVLKSWDLPADLVEPVNWHHAPALSPFHSVESNVICLADHITRAVEDPDGGYLEKAEAICLDVEAGLDHLLETAEELFESEEIGHFVEILT